jgi:hypothetical protein
MNYRVILTLSFLLMQLYIAISCFLFCVFFFFYIQIRIYFIILLFYIRVGYCGEFVIVE